MALKSGERTRFGLKRGNIDLSNRPVVHNPNGSFSTIKSASTQMKGKEVLFPTVVNAKKRTPGTKAESKDAKIVSVDEAKKIAGETGKNLGTFRTGTQADQYANIQHNIEAKKYTRKGEYIGPKNVWDEKRGMWRTK